MKVQSGAAGEVLICNVTVDPLYRRQGMGTQLVEFVRRRLPRNRPRLVNRVDESDLASQYFLARLGFVCYDPGLRCARDREQQVYTFEWRRPEWKGLPRFEWPPP